MVTVDEIEIDRLFIWTCATCSDQGSGSTTITAIKHIHENLTHTVIGSAMSMYKFEASILERQFRGQSVEDVPLPGESLE